MCEMACLRVAKEEGGYSTPRVRTCLRLSNSQKGPDGTFLRWSIETVWPLSTDSRLCLLTFFRLFTRWSIHPLID